MNHIGPYLLDSIRATEGQIEVWLAQDAITGVPALVYKPVLAELPDWHIEGVLPWTARVADAWVAELPFGAVPLSSRGGAAAAPELTAWARRLLVALLEMRALNLRHGRISPEHIWVKGEQAWIEGLGLPLEANEPDEAALTAALRAAAGDSWPGWPFHAVMERLAEGRISLREAAEQLTEPRSAAEVESILEDEPGEEEAASFEPPPTGTVRVIGRGEARERAPQETAPKDEAGESAEVNPAGADAAAAAAEEISPMVAGEEPPPTSAADEPAASEPPAPDARPTSQPELLNEETVRVKGPAKSAEPSSPPADNAPASEPAARATSERPVVRIDEVSEPAFEVIEPGGGASPRSLLRYGLLAFTALLLVFAAVWYARSGGSGGGTATNAGYAVEFRLEPSDAHAELVLLEAPEGSQLVSDRVLAVIPGKVYFDVPGVYRIQLRADGYLPQEKLLAIPPKSRVITVRLSR